MTEGKVTGPEAYDRLSSKVRIPQRVTFLEAITYIEWWLAKPFENAASLDIQAFEHLYTNSVFIRFPDASIFDDEIYTKLIAIYRQAGWGDLTILYGDNPDTEYQVHVVLSKPLKHS